MCKIVHTARIQIARANETPNVLKTLLRVIMYLHFLQGLILRCGWFPPAIPNIETEILYLFMHELTFLEFGAEMAFLTDIEKVL